MCHSELCGEKGRQSKKPQRRRSHLGAYSGNTGGRQEGQRFWEGNSTGMSFQHLCRNMVHFKTSRVLKKERCMNNGKCFLHVFNWRSKRMDEHSQLQHGTRTWECLKRIYMKYPSGHLNRKNSFPSHPHHKTLICLKQCEGGMDGSLCSELCPWCWNELHLLSSRLFIPAYNSVMNNWNVI